MHVLRLRLLGKFWLRSLWGIWYKESCYFTKPDFLNSVWLIVHKHALRNKRYPRLFDMHSYASVRSLSPETLQVLDDNFCFMTHHVFFKNLFVLYLQACLDFVIVHIKLPTNSMTNLIRLIADVYSCACLAVFDSSLIIITRLFAKSPDMQLTHVWYHSLSVSLPVPDISALCYSRFSAENTRWNRTSCGIFTDARFLLMETGGCPQVEGICFGGTA